MSWAFSSICASLSCIFCSNCCLRRPFASDSDSLWCIFSSICSFRRPFSSSRDWHWYIFSFIFPLSWAFSSICASLSCIFCSSCCLRRPFSFNCDSLFNRLSCTSLFRRLNSSDCNSHRRNSFSICCLSWSYSSDCDLLWVTFSSTFSAMIRSITSASCSFSLLFLFWSNAFPILFLRSSLSSNWDPGCTDFSVFVSRWSVSFPCASHFPTILPIFTLSWSSICGCCWVVLFFAFSLRSYNSIWSLSSWVTFICTLSLNSSRFRSRLFWFFVNKFSASLLAWGSKLNLQRISERGVSSTTSFGRISINGPCIVWGSTLKLLVTYSIQPPESTPPYRQWEK